MKRVLLVKNAARTRQAARKAGIEIVNPDLKKEHVQPDEQEQPDIV